MDSGSPHYSLVSTLWLGLFSFKHIAFLMKYGCSLDFSSIFTVFTGNGWCRYYSFCICSDKIRSSVQTACRKWGMPVNYGTIRVLIGKSSQSSAWLGVLGDKQFSSVKTMMLSSCTPLRLDVGSIWILRYSRLFPPCLGFQGRM